MLFKKILSLLPLLYLTQCATSPRVSAPLEITEINNSIQLMVDSGTEALYVENIKLAKYAADMFHKSKLLFKLNGNKNYIYIIDHLIDNASDIKFVEISPKSILFYQGSFQNEFEISEMAAKLISDSGYKKVWFVFIQNENIVESPLSNDSVLIFGGGRILGLKNNDTTAEELHLGTLKVIPDRRLMHMRSSSISLVPNAVDITQFLLTKYNLNNQYIMMKNEEFYQLYFNYKENKNYLIKKIN